MKIAFSKPTADEAGLDRLLTGFRHDGYEGLQLKSGQFAPWLGRAGAWADRWGDDPGRTSALIVFDDLDPAGEARLADAIRFAAATGGERIVFCQNRDRTGVDDAFLRDLGQRLSAIGRAAADVGVAMSFHHHTGQPVMTPHDVRVFFKAVQPGTVGLTVDTAHLAKSGVEDIPAFIGEFGPVIDNVHLKDYADGEWRLLGEGGLDLPGILRVLDEAGFDGWLCVDEESAADLETGLSRSRAWLDAHLQSA